MLDDGNRIVIRPLAKGGGDFLVLYMFLLLFLYKTSKGSALDSPKVLHIESGNSSGHCTTHFANAQHTWTLRNAFRSCATLLKANFPDSDLSGNPDRSGVYLCKLQSMEYMLYMGSLNA